MKLVITKTCLAMFVLLCGLDVAANSEAFQSGTQDGPASTIDIQTTSKDAKDSTSDTESKAVSKDVIVNIPLEVFDAEAAGDNLSGIKYYRTFGVDFHKPKKDGLYQYVDDELADSFIEYTNKHKIEVIWTLYVTSRTLKQELEYVQSLIKKKMNIVAFEYGGEFYLPKYAMVNKAKKGVIEKVTPSIYIDMLKEWLPTFTEVLPFSKGDHIIIGASHGNTESKSDQHRKQWNLDVVKLLKEQFPEHMDKLSWSFHLYKGSKPDKPKNGEEEIVGEVDFSFMKDFPEEMKIFVTESGYYIDEFSDAQLELAEAFWTELYQALRPTDVYGIHVLLNKTKRPNSLALVDREGELTPVGKRFEAWLTSRDDSEESKDEKKSD
ncbi:MAG: hypothetical protein R3E76_17300 [Planctomycetota bacterium]